MKIVFMGTPDFACIVLNHILKSKHEITGVVCAKDTFKRNKIVYPAVKTLALQNSLSVFQPEKISNELEILNNIDADIIVTCAFGQLLKQNVLDYYKHGVINVHPSLLPKYRGTSPVQWAIINGEKTSGCTIMHTDIGMDSGDIIMQKPLDILENESAGEYNTRVFEMAGEMLVAVLDNIENGTSTRVKQNHSQHTYHPALSKQDGKINFNQSSQTIINKIRGYNPWPVAFCFICGKRINVFSATVAPEFDLKEAKPGEVVSTKKGLYIKTLDGVIRLNEICTEGKNKQDSSQFLNGNKINVGEVAE